MMFFGQDHLVARDGVLNVMIEKSKILSFILYGPPGTGKTTIANIFAEKCGLEFYFFNASTDTKQKLKDILDTTIYKDILIVIDEIHRMKKRYSRLSTSIYGKWKSDSHWTYDT